MTRKFTLTRLAAYLNNKYDCKSTGKPFTAQDAQGYITRGRIPIEYGGQFLVLDKGIMETTGVKAYRLEEKLA